MARIKQGQSAYDSALRFLAPKARTVRETEVHLDSGNYSEGEIMQTIERLQNAGLLNDEKYAADFVSSRLNTKPVSRQKLKEQLEKHYIDERIIQNALHAVDNDVESANAMAVAQKYNRQFSNLPQGEREKRVFSRLQARGYSFELIRKIMSDSKGVELD